MLITYSTDHVQAIRVHKALVLVERSVRALDAPRNVLVDAPLAGMVLDGW
jgi:hypothetical protein